MLLLIATLLLSLFSLNTFSGSVKDFENEEKIKINRLKDYFKKHQSETIKTLASWVEMDTETHHAENIRHLGDLIAKELSALGFDCIWHDLPPSLHHQGTLIAKHPGTQGKRMLLIGHFDTVLSASDFKNPFSMEGSTAKGPGVIDNKGGLVVMLYALKALDHFNALKDADITIALTGDEESAAKPKRISRSALKDAASHLDVALDLEWSFNQDTATIARRGVTHWILKTYGKPAHSSSIFSPESGDGAIFELVRILKHVQDVFSKQKNLSFNPALIIGGTELKKNHQTETFIVKSKDNIMASQAMAQGDLRFASKEQEESARIYIQDLIKNPLPQTKTEVFFSEGMPPMPNRQANLDLLKIYSSISEDLGFGPVHALDPGIRGAGDISFIADQVPACLAGLGPVGSGAHSPDERLEVDSLSMQGERLALLIDVLKRS